MRKIFTFLLALAASVGMSWGATITVTPSEHGSVVASPTSAEAGATITLTATPDDGYQLKSISGVYVPVSETLNFVNGNTTATGTKFQCVGTIAAGNYGWRVFNTGTDSTLTVSSLNGATLIEKIEFTSTWGKQRTNDMLSVSEGTLSFDENVPSTTVTINDINATSVTISGSGNNAAKTWCIASVKVYYEGTDEVELEISDTENANVKTFTMVDSEVTISAEFEPAPAPEPTYLDADFAIDFRTDPYTVVGGGALPDGVTVDGSMNTGDATHGYSQPVITIPVTAGNYLVKMGTCQFSNADGSVKNEDGSVTYTTLATNNGTCYHQNTSKNYVAAIITIPSDQIIKVHGAQYTPYFAIQKMPEIPAFTDFAINFMSDSYTVAEGTLPAGTVIDGTPNTGQTAHGYQNVVATVPVKAGKYRLTLGTCQYGTGTGNVMSETNIELASFDQKTAACYHQNPAENIISMIFDVDQDQHITIDCGNYTPYMKLEVATSYQVSFALSDAEGTAPAALDVTIGENITMPVNKTLYKAGYTLTGWSDGVNTYPIGESFTPANDVVLTPVFTANEADLLNASSDVTVKWYFGGDNGAPTTSYEGTSGLLVAQATIGDKTVDVKLSIDATSGKFAPQATTEWAQVKVGTIFTYPYKEGMTVNVGNYNSEVTYYIADAEGKVTCGKNDYYSFIQVTYPASLPTGVEDVQSDKVQATKFFRDGQLLIERDGKTYNAQGAQVR